MHFTSENGNIQFVSIQKKSIYTEISRISMIVSSNFERGKQQIVSLCSLVCNLLICETASSFVFKTVDNLDSNQLV